MEYRNMNCAFRTIFIIPILFVTFSRFNGARNLVFRGFTVEACRRFGLQGNNVHKLSIEQMEVKNTGMTEWMWNLLK